MRTNFPSIVVIFFLFIRKFVFVVVSCFLPVILYSQGSLKSSYIWEDVQQTTKAILIHDQNQEVDLVYFDFKPFIKAFVSFIALQNPQTPEQVLDNIRRELLNVLSYSENMRLQTLETLLYSDDMQVQQNIVPILKAIFNRDSHFFGNPTEEQEKGVGTIFFPSQETEGKEEPILVTHFLLEAVRKSFLPAVQYILNSYHKSDLVSEEVESLSLDPLSLSLVTYASLQPGHPFKGEAKEIIRLLADHTDVNRAYNFPLRFTSMVWSVFFGLKEEVEFLHEQKKVDLEFTFVFRSSGRNWFLYPIDYTHSMEFVQLSQYLRDKRGTSNCKQAFFQ